MVKRDDFTPTGAVGAWPDHGSCRVKIGAPCVLTINGGSSSIRFAIFAAGAAPGCRLRGKIDRIGLRGTNLAYCLAGENSPAPRRCPAGSHRAAVEFLLDWLEARPVFASVTAVGHRVVHGMKHTEPERVTTGLLAELRRLTPYDPDHLPREIELIEAFRQRHPQLPQVACFDRVSSHHAADRENAADPAALRG